MHLDFAQCKQKGFAPVVFIILALVLVTGGVAGYIILSKPKVPAYAPSPPATTPDQTSKVFSGDETAGWKIYKSGRGAFSIKYPQYWETYNYGGTPKDEPLDVGVERFFRPTGQLIPQITLRVYKQGEVNLETFRTMHMKIKPNFETGDYLIIDGVEALRVKFKDSKDREAIKFISGDYYYEFVGGPVDILEKMLSTFKFLDQNDEIIKSESMSPDGLKKIIIKSSGGADTFKKWVTISNINGDEKIVLLIEGVGTEELFATKVENWSSDSKYVYLQTGLPDGGDLYVFKSDGDNFKNGKSYLLAGNVGYNQMPLSKPKWISNTKLEFEGGVSLVIKPEKLNKYFLDVEKEKLFQE